MRFVGDRLRVGRTFRDVTLRQLADDIASSAAVLSRVELNRKEPSDDLVGAIAQRLEFNRDFFYKPIADEFTQKECSFRKKVATAQKVKNRILAQGTLISELVLELQKIVRFPSVNIPRFPNVWGMDAIDEIALEVRKHWGYGEGPVGNMIRVLEHAGVIVIRLHDDSRNVDAFARPGAVPYVILNDAKGSTSRARMDMAHELGHLVLHNGATEPEQEEEAERFAAAFLLPAGAFGRQFLSYRSVDWPELFDMKRYWRVSVAAIIRRGYTLGFIQPIEYMRRFRYIRFREWHKGEPFEPENESPEILYNAIATVSGKIGGAEQLMSRLGWTSKTFLEITGFAQNQTDDEIVPLTRARLLSV